jgi:translation elongation factor EF-1alpha
MRPGDEVVVLPVGKSTQIAAIEGPNGPVEEAFPPMAVSVTLADEIDISRGDLIARTNNQPRVAQEFDATVCWMADDAGQGNGPGLPARRQHFASRQDRDGVEAQRARAHFPAHAGAVAARRVHP